METQLIKKFRTKKGLSQKDLADKVKTSQQQIARLETGLAPVRLDMAARISEALGTSMAQVFPALAPVLKKFPGEKIRTGRALNELDRTGIEADATNWEADIYLRGGGIADFELTSSNERRLQQALLNWTEDAADRSEPFDFAWFESDLYEVRMNRKHVSYAKTHPKRLDTENSVDKAPSHEVSEMAPYVLVWVAGEKDPIEIECEEDCPRPENSDFGNLREILMSLDLRNEGRGKEDTFISLTDIFDTSYAFRLSDVAMLAIPRLILEPALILNEEDEEDEAIEMAVVNGRMVAKEATAKKSTPKKTA